MNDFKVIMKEIVKTLNDDDLLANEDLIDIAVAKEEKSKGEVYSFSDIENGLFD